MFQLIWLVSFLKNAALIGLKFLTSILANFFLEFLAYNAPKLETKVQKEI